MLWRGDKGWKRHQGFGLRQAWLEWYYRQPIEWKQRLGNRQVESLQAWLKTAGFEDRGGRVTPLAERLIARGFDDPAAWELVWVQVVFNWPTARWYVWEMGLGRWTTRDLQERLQVSLKNLARRTVRNAIDELVGLLEHTPIGTVLGQGEIRGGRPRTVERRGNPYPSEEAVKLAFERLFTAEGRSCLPADAPLLWPWVVFGCPQKEIMARLGDGLLQEYFVLADEGQVVFLCRR